MSRETVEYVYSKENMHPRATLDFTCRGSENAENKHNSSYKKT